MRRKNREATSHKLHKETALQQSVNQQRAECFKRYHRIMKESKDNPVVLLSPKSYSKLILDRPIPQEYDIPQIFEEYTNPDLLDANRTESMEAKVQIAMNRFTKVPYYQQDYGYKLIKM